MNPTKFKTESVMDLPTNRENFVLGIYIHKFPTIYSFGSHISIPALTGVKFGLETTARHISLPTLRHAIPLR